MMFYNFFTIYNKFQKMSDTEMQINQNDRLDSPKTDQVRESLAKHNISADIRRPKAKNIKQTFRRLFSYTLKHKQWLILANLSLLLSTGGMIYLPLLCGVIIDHIKDNQNFKKDCLTFVGLSILMAIFSAIRGYSFNILSQNVVMDIRKQLFKELVGKDIYYYDRNKTGALISRLTSDTSVIQSAAGENIAILIRNILQFIGSFAFLILISLKLTLFILIVTPIVSIIVMLIMKKVKGYKKEYQSNLAFANSLASQVFGNIRVVRSFSKQDYQCKNYQSLLVKTYEVGRKRAYIQSLMLFFIIFFANILILSVLYFGGLMAQSGDMTIGSLTSFVLYTITLTTGLTSISGTLNQISSAMGVSESIFQILDEPVSLISGSYTPKFEDGQNIIEFINAEFAYPSKPNVNILSDFNLAIKKGESIAIVGASGAGKSSIINLIQRFYDLNSGQLRIGGVDIRDLDLQLLRPEIGIVSQQPTLFSGTIKENIEYGLKSHQKSQKKIIQALQISNAKQFAMNPQTFPDLLNTIIGERGVILSGGQKQRIAIARSIIKNPQILIFDEATSALDAHNEHLVQTAIDKLFNRRQTMIIVAHRLTTIMNCDRIVVLKEGKIVEQGNHQQLISKEGIYANLIKRQTSQH